ncbi:MAG: gas vesicle protein GvpD [Nanoarchaeota archaeon]|nr:gas vesicle protein GvpD [Nanoarchaeota archaeon]
MERIKSGIPGFDEKIEGGFEKGSIITVVGGPGSGKSIFGMQFLYQGLKDGENCLYVSLEEQPDDIKRDMLVLGMDPTDYISKGSMLISFASPLNFEYLPIIDLVRQKNVSRLVIDSISALALYFEDRAKFRKFLLDLISSLKGLNVTTILIDEEFENGSNDVKAFSGEYLADAVINLFYTGLGGEYDRSIQVMKMRRTNQYRAVIPMKIDKGGIYVK